MDFLKLRRGIFSSETEESKTQGLSFTYPFATNVASAAACFCSCSHWDSSPSCSTCGWPTGAGRMELLHQTSCCCCSSSSQEVAGGNAWATCYRHELRHNYLSLLELRQVQGTNEIRARGATREERKKMQRLWCRLLRASCATACTSRIKLRMGPTHHSQLSKEIERVDCVLQAYHSLSLSLSLSLSVSDPNNAEVSGSHNKSCRH